MTVQEKIKEIKKRLLEGVSKEEIINDMNITIQLVNFCENLNKIKSFKTLEIKK